MSDLFRKAIEKEKQLRLFEAVLKEFCEEVERTLRRFQGFGGSLEVIPLLREITQKAVFKAESVEHNGIPAIGLHISFPEEELEYRTQPLGIVSTMEDMKLLPDKFIASVNGFIEFLLENLWKFLPHKCQAGESGGDPQ